MTGNEGDPASQLRPQIEQRKRRVALWIVLIPVGIIASVALVVGVGFFFHYTASEIPVTEKDREMILDISTLARWIEGYKPDVGKETVVKRRFWDRTVELEYEYSVPEDEGAPYLQFVVGFERKRSDAVIAYHSMWGGAKLGLHFGGEAEVSIKERNDLFKWGDQSRFGMLVHKGSPGGNVFVARKGKRVVTVVIAGIYFDDRETISELLTPVLDKIGRPQGVTGILP